MPSGILPDDEVEVAYRKVHRILLLGFSLMTEMGTKRYTPPVSFFFF